jgi:hypothetical protein
MAGSQKRPVNFAPEVAWATQDRRCESARGVCARTQAASCKTFDDDGPGCATSWVRWGGLVADGLLVCASAARKLWPASAEHHSPYYVVARFAAVPRLSSACSAPRPHRQVHRTTRYAPVPRPGLRRLFPHGTKDMMLRRTHRCAAKLQAKTSCQEWKKRFIRCRRSRIASVNGEYVSTPVATDS